MKSTLMVMVFSILMGIWGITIAVRTPFYVEDKIIGIALICLLEFAVFLEAKKKIMNKK